MNVLKLNGVDFNLYDNGPVGLSISGGADSALVLYLLATQIKQPIHTYAFFCDEDIPVRYPVVEQVVETVRKLTNRIDISVELIRTGYDGFLTMFDTLSDKMNSGEIAMTYTGFTKFPPDEVIKNFPGKLDDWHYNFRKDSNTHSVFGWSVPELNVTAEERIYNPFINQNKKFIHQVYTDFGLLESLFPITRSCENNDHPNGNCGQCWWCHERIWAFGHV